LGVSIVAQLALLMWLPLALLLASVLPARRAVLATVIGGTLFLPETVAFDFPVFPPLDKQAIALLCALIVALTSSEKLLSGRQNTAAAQYVALLAVVGVCGTVVTNPEPLQYGPVYVPPMTAYDGVSFVINALLRIVLPFYLGQAVFRTPEHLKELLRALIFGALIYVPFILIEARLSPIFHLRLYGFFQHDFLQSIRAGGFRAFVFMSHGLAVAFFVGQALIGSAALARIRDRSLPLSPMVLAAVLAVTLVSCKSMGAFIYAGIGFPLVYYASTRLQVRVASWIAVIVLAYPLARTLDLVPTEWLLAKAHEVSADRAQSLGFRFDNERLLLEHAQLKPYFGWGEWGRNHLVNPEDGKPITVTDGEWIIQFGVGGAYRFFLYFGMLLLPVFWAKKAVRSGKMPEAEERTLAVMTVILGFVGLDLLPNAVYNPLPYFIAGAVGSVARGVLGGHFVRGAAGAVHPAREHVARQHPARRTASPARA
jgi:hypothetical protein